jgi:hypothetical protein
VFKVQQEKGGKMAFVIEKGASKRDVRRELGEREIIFDLEAFYTQATAKGVRLVGLLGPAGSTWPGAKAYLEAALAEYGCESPIIFVTNGTKEGTGGLLTRAASRRFPVLAIYPTEISEDLLLLSNLTFRFPVPPVIAHVSYWETAAVPLVAYLSSLICFGGGHGSAFVVEALSVINKRRIAFDSHRFLGRTPGSVASIAYIPIPNEPRPALLKKIECGDIGGFYGVLDPKDPSALAEFLRNAS